MSGADVGANASQSEAPPKPPVNVTVRLCPGNAVVVLTDRVGAGTIVHVSNPDVPPPGGAVVTDTCAMPTAATSALPIVVRSSVALTNVVARAPPFQFTTEAAVKLDPFTVSVNPLRPTTAVDGDSELTTGTGGGTKIAFTVGLVAARV